jgi:hypothetical protein
VSDLNLLPSSAKFQAERIRLKTLVTNFLWIFGGAWLLLVVFVFLFEFVLNLNLKNLNGKYKVVSTQYESLSENMALTQKIKYQAKVVGTVLSNRFEYGESMKLVKGLFSDDVVIENLEIDNEKKFSIEGSVSRGEFLNEVEDMVEMINSGSISGFKAAEINNVSVNNSGGWKFKLGVEIK